ncbi:uncharacterized protein YecT (DUF1311 family) [Paenibacillus sp. DS2015]|uniref:lysozyme inhibitor LprI family protein n=1 Tax=Paenibacillus sp. DS2015 TaxID=3373917 RepID=UPI003D1C1D50
MRKLMISTLLTCILITGCSNNVNEGSNIQQPVPIEQEETIKEEKNEVDKEVDKIEEEKIEKEEAPTIEKEIATSEKKEEYIQKLNAIEEGLADLQDLYEEGTTVSMKTAAGETYKRWDTALNEIYSVLKEQLSTSEMAGLKKKQLNWITFRDETAKDESLEYKGGTMESLQYTASLLRITKERCYELVKQYMK